MRRGGLRVQQAAQLAGVFTLGAALGSVIAIFCAPASGRVIRKRLLRRIQTTQRSAMRQLNRTRHQLVAQATQAREWVTEHLPTNGQRRPLRRRVVHAS